MQSTFKEVCDVYMFGKNDEARQKSEKFLAFWGTFIDDVQKNMPKVEKKKAPKKPSKTSAPKKSAADDALQAELAAVLAKKRK